MILKVHDSSIWKCSKEFHLAIDISLKGLAEERESANSVIRSSCIQCPQVILCSSAHSACSRMYTGDMERP